MSDSTPDLRDEAIRARARESFEHSVAKLDQASAKRLRLMRREAIARSRPTTRAWGPPLLAAALVVLAVGLAWRNAPTPSKLQPEIAPNADDIPTSGLPSEEDADLYAWLGEAPVAPARGDGL